MSFIRVFKEKKIVTVKDSWPGLSVALSFAESVRGLGVVIEPFWSTHPFYRTWTITMVT